MANQSEYLLKVGDEGALRLKLLNEMCNIHTFNFIDNHISLHNKSILDIGCGTGILAGEFASRCLPNGKVLATDISVAQINLSKKIASANQINNISFEVIDAEQIDFINHKFDIIYCRFLLAHLKNPHIVIEKILALMHEDSILVCEEPIDVDCMYCSPYEPLFDVWRKAMYKQVEISKANFTIGNLLPNILGNNKLKIQHSAIVQPIMTNARLKQQLWLGIYELKFHLIKHGFASESQLDLLIEDLKYFSENTQSQIGYFKYKQILATL